MGEGHHKGGECVPGAGAKALGLLPAVCEKDLPLPQVAGVLHGVFVFLHEVPVAGDALDGDPDFFHGAVSPYSINTPSGMS